MSSPRTSRKSFSTEPRSTRRRQAGAANRRVAGRAPAASKKPAKKSGKVRQRASQKLMAPSGATHPRRVQKILMASGSAATLAMLAIVPTRVASQAIAQSSCQEVVRSGAEMSRGQIEKLLATPEGTAREAVRQIIETPYCLLPAIEAPEKVLEKAPAAPKSAEDAVAFADSVTVEVEREAYPLAFDPEAWVVVNYAADEYVGYDFVFKP